MNADKLLDRMRVAGSIAFADGGTDGAIDAALRVFVEKHDLRSLNDGKDLPTMMLALTNMASDLLELTDTEKHAHCDPYDPDCPICADRMDEAREVQAEMEGE